MTIPRPADVLVPVPIIDQGIELHARARARLPVQRLARLGRRQHEFAHHDPARRSAAARDPANPLGVAAPVAGNVLAGRSCTSIRRLPPPSPARLRAIQSGLVVAARRHRLRARRAPFLHVEHDRQHRGPGGSLPPGHPAAAARQTVMLSTYNIVHESCGCTATPTCGRATTTSCTRWRPGSATSTSIFFLELDSLITAPVPEPRQLAIRRRNCATPSPRSRPIRTSSCTWTVAPPMPCLPPARRELLRASGVGQAQGFFLNSTHFDWIRSRAALRPADLPACSAARTSSSTAVRTGAARSCPQDRVKHGNEVLCNPPGRGLGPLSVAKDVAQPTGYANADGFLWFTNPGGSGGQCAAGRAAAPACSGPPTR